MNSLVKRSLSVVLVTLTATTSFAANDNGEFARELESKTISATYKPSFLAGSKKAVIAVDSSQNLSVSFEQFPELGTCTGKMNVTDDDIYIKNGKMIMDADGLRCTGARGTYFRLMLAVNTESSEGVLNLSDASGKWIISAKKATLDVK